MKYKITVPITGFADKIIEAESIEECAKILKAEGMSSFCTRLIKYSPKEARFETVGEPVRVECCFEDEDGE